MSDTPDGMLLGKMAHVLFPLLFLLLITSCREDHQPPVARVLHCTDCHTVELDANHNLPCTSCHHGNDQAQDKAGAHQQLVTRPAHPENMKEACASCHGKIVARIQNSDHFTLANTTNSFRKAFGATATLKEFRDVPVAASPTSALDLADDLLRRRCFRCHPYSAGDDYPAVRRGVGCAACHMSFVDGKPETHVFRKPEDPQCLSCHYGNTVGFDYYGRFEHDYHLDYRTPFTTTDAHFRPYGVEFHQMEPDIHQQQGLACRDCHAGNELMGGSTARPSCASCHSAEALAAALPPRVEKIGGEFILDSVDGRKHPIPLIRHRAHFDTSERITCQACHARWTFNDFGKHYLRSDTDDFDPWTFLAVQGSSEVEKLIEHNTDPENTELPPTMTDKLSGTSRPGVWYKGYTMRRWEEPILGRDNDGSITTMRPQLDYFLSWVDSEGKIRFNSVSTVDSRGGWRPYVPHSIGPAGLFYRERIDSFVEKEKKHETNESYPLYPRQPRSAP